MILYLCCCTMLFFFNVDTILNCTVSVLLFCILYRTRFYDYAILGVLQCFDSTRAHTHTHIHTHTHRMKATWKVGPIDATASKSSAAHWIFPVSYIAPCWKQCTIFLFVAIPIEYRIYILSCFFGCTAVDKKAYKAARGERKDILYMSSPSPRQSN